MLWRLNALVSLNLRRWDDEWVVFDGGSGQTHLMDTLTAMTLLLLEAGPASQPQIATKISAELELVESPDFSLKLTEVLTGLCDTGMVEQVLQ